MRMFRIKRKQLKSGMIASAIVFGLFSCQPDGRVFVEHQELSPDLEWVKEDKPTFEVPIAEAGSVFNMSLTFRYATGYQFPIVKVLVIETSPSGVETTLEYELEVKDKDGNYIGEPALDIWDSTHLISASKRFEEAGTYTYEVTHNMPQNPLNYAMELGVVLDEIAEK